jgi:hypothetical protein
MKSFVKQTTLGLVLGLLVCGIAVGSSPSCAHVGPTLTCFGENITSGDILRVEEGYRTKNWADLILFAAQRGWPIFDCITDDRVAAKPELAPAAREFRKQTEYKGAKPEASGYLRAKPDGTIVGLTSDRYVERYVDAATQSTCSPLRTGTYDDFVRMCVGCGGSRYACELVAQPLLADPAPVQAWDGWLTIDWNALDIVWPEPPARI